VKRVLGALLFMIAFPALAAQPADVCNCQTAASCTSVPLRFASAAAWTGTTGSCGNNCGGTAPDSNDTWTIAAGCTINSDEATRTAGTGTVLGSLYLDPSSASRDGNGFRNLVVTTTAANTGIQVGASGRLTWGPSDRVRFDTTAGVGRLSYNNGAIIRMRGSFVDTTVAAVTASDDGADAVCGHNGTNIGRKWVVTPAAGLGSVKVGRRIIVKSGKLITHHAEVAAVGASTFTICSNLADGSSLGQRLTPYGTANGTDPGPGTAGHHTVPTVTAGLDACTGAGAPFPCCSGAGAGTCVDGPDPAIGDAITIVDDAWIDQSAGTAGWNFQDAGDGTVNCGGGACVGADPLPVIQYANLAGIGGGGNGTGVIAGQFVVRTSNQAMTDYVGNNWHGWKSDYGIVFKGNKNFQFAWSAVHDSQQAAGTSDSYCQMNFHQNKVSENGTLDTPVADIDIHHNIAWRTKQCAFQINDAENGSESPHSIFQALRIKLRDNLVYENGGVAGSNGSCIAAGNPWPCCSGAGTGSCGIDTFGLHVHSCKGCQVRRNVVFEVYNADATTGTGIKLGGTASLDGTDVSNNWIVNVGGYGIRCDDDNSAPTNLANCQKVTMVNNYISHTRDACGRGGIWISDLCRNFALDNSGRAPGLRNPVVGRGLYVGVDPAVAAASVCTSSVNRCMGGAISFGNHDGNRNRTAVTLSDIVIGPQSENAGTNRYGLDNEGIGGLAVADFNLTANHITHDNRATSGNGYARVVNFATTNPSVAVTWTINDVLTGYRNDDTLVVCTAAGNVTETLGSFYSLQTDSTIEGGGVTSGTCSTPATVTRPGFIDWRNRAAFDYGLNPGSPEYTAGVGGSAMGSRLFTFNRSRIQAAWGGSLTFDGTIPADFANGVSGADSDGDLVPDLWDNCVTKFNPGQYDSDADGKGCLCDASGDTCP
jgi:hypothetical protein